MTKSKTYYHIRALCEGAIFVAIAELLGYLKLFHMPQGGSITPASMLPVMMLML